MQINTDNIAQQCLNAINDKINNLKRLNIIVIGKSGVGKSTLINSLFRGNFVDKINIRNILLKMNTGIMKRREYMLILQQGSLYSFPQINIIQDAAGQALQNLSRKML